MPDLYRAHSRDSMSACVALTHGRETDAFRDLSRDRNSGSEEPVLRAG
jgi:hypothetical protein